MIGLGSTRVSVVVAVRDRRAMLDDLLRALDAQTLTDFEVIVVDDGSTDGSGELAGRRTVAGRPVLVLEGGAEGAVAARRRGAAIARSPVLAFTDSDCVPEPDWLARLVAAVDAGADVVNGRTKPARPPAPGERTLGSENEGLYPTCNVAYRRTAFEAAGGFDPEAGRRLAFRPPGAAVGLGFGEDTLLAWRVRRDGTARYEPRAVVVHQVLDTGWQEEATRAWMTGAFPALLREVPELTGTLLVGRVFLGTPVRLWLYGAAAASVARRPRLAAAALGGWAVSRATGMRRADAAPGAAPRALARALMVDSVTAAALVAGSVRARRLVA